MNEPRQSNKSDPTPRVALFIVVVVLLVVATFVFNAIKGKRAYDEQNAAATAPAAATSAATPAGASAASQ